VNISVFGLGYVGTVTAACLAQDGHFVIGVDVNPHKVATIGRGEAPFVEDGLGELLSQVRRKRRLEATVNARRAVAETEISLVCVGTPSSKNSDLDLSHVRRVSLDIGASLARKRSRHLVVLRSTVLPGTTQRVVIPLLERASGKKEGKGFGVCYNPEFLREGSAIEDFYHPPKTVIGESRAEDGDLLGRLYKKLPGQVIRTEIPVAEMVKYSDNAFHALKIAFANELGRICRAHGIDSHKVMDIFCSDTKLNISTAYLMPGFAFGGSCLPKDLRALLYRAGRKDLDVPLLKAILESNRQQIQLAVEMIKETGKRRIGLCGLSFKAQTDDLRESPLVELIETLLGKGYNVKIFDPNVSLARLHGTNKEYMERHIPHLWKLLTDSVDLLLDHAEVIVIGNRLEEATEILRRAQPGHIVIDLVRVGPQPSTRAKYHGIVW